MTSLHDLSHQQFHQPNHIPVAENEQLEQLALRYLEQPLLTQQLCDRVYARFRSDLLIQRERFGNSSVGRQ